MFGMDTIIVLLSALAAAGSFMAFALPFLNREEKKERYRSVIEKKRKALFEQSKQQMAQRGKGEKQLSARESVAMSFKVQEMLGELGEKVRDQMLQAGIRNPSAPLKFMIARIVLPFFFVGTAMFFISQMEKDLSNTVTLAIIAGAAFVGYKLPGLIIKNQIQKRSQEINLTFPDALDMMLICVQGGIGLEQTVDRIAEEVAEHSPTLAEELGILSAEMAMLNDRRTALQDFARRVGSGAAKSFATALIQAEQYGTSVSQALRVMSEDLRDQRMAAAEQKAAALPPKLTVPMIAFFLPVLFVVILGPTILQFLQTR
ncbi:MAG: type II secretion system F family protein [Proteobacteria bacterium]|nr:type II secretion system F family protein [Pseudomonadota bacterium]